MAVITISRQRGSMGSYIALEVARELNLRYLDREILQSVAREAGVDAEAVEALEARAGRLARTLHILGARPKLPAVASASIRSEESQEERVQELMMLEGVSQEVALARLRSAPTSDYVPQRDYLDLTTSVILEQAAQGKAMIVGRGGQMILRDKPDVLHVQVIARFETRVYNVIEREEVKWREAAHRVRQSDEQRAGYMRRFYNVDWLDSSLYDLVISTDKIPIEVAVDTVIRAASALGSKELQGPQD
ncbi:MAG: cytidylate kinase-like family protein [Anaerolineae bacterium]|nr:cytidylate kinase-like family protein [Anaerolineae bacterium]